MGANKRPFFRVVVADQRSPRDGRFIENIGRYHPMDDPSVIEIDRERALHWLRVGAQPSDQVRHLLDRVGIWEAFVAERPSVAVPIKPGRAEKPEKPKLSKKAAAKAAAPPEPEPAVEPAQAEEPAAAAEDTVEETPSAEVSAPDPADAEVPGDEGSDGA